MDQRVRKLKTYFGGSKRADIEALVAAGLFTPRQIREASDEEVLAVSGIGEAKLTAIRAKLGQRHGD